MDETKYTWESLMSAENYMMEKDTFQEDFHHFCQVTTDFDMRHGKDLKSVFPEIAPYLIDKK